MKIARWSLVILIPLLTIWLFLDNRSRQQPGSSSFPGESAIGSKEELIHAGLESDQPHLQTDLEQRERQMILASGDSPGVADHTLSIVVRHEDPLENWHSTNLIHFSEEELYSQAYKSGSLDFGKLFDAIGTSVELDKQGRAQLASPMVDSWLVARTKDSMGIQAFKAGSRGEYTLLLSKADMLEARVLNHRNQPMPEIWVSLILDNGSYSDAIQKRLTGPDGRASFMLHSALMDGDMADELENYRAQLKLQVNGAFVKPVEEFVPYPQGTSISRTQPRRFDLELPPTGILEIIPKPPIAPVDGPVYVDLLKRDAHGNFQAALIRSELRDGLARFETIGLHWSGFVALKLLGHEVSPIQIRGPTSPEESLSLEVDFQVGPRQRALRARGRFVNGDGLALPEVQVGHDYPGLHWNPRLKANEFGEFVFVIEPRDLHYDLEGPGAPSSVNIVFTNLNAKIGWDEHCEIQIPWPPNGIHELGDVEFQRTPLNKLAWGQVVDAKGEPVEGAAIELEIESKNSEDNGEWAWCGSSTTDRFGSFVIFGTNTDLNLNLSIEHDEYIALTSLPVNPSEKLEITLETGIVWRGIVLLPEWARAGEDYDMVILEDEASALARGSSQSIRGHVSVGKKGLGQSSRLRPGRYSIQLLDEWGLHQFHCTPSFSVGSSLPDTSSSPIDFRPFLQRILIRVVDEEGQAVPNALFMSRKAGVPSFPEGSTRLGTGTGYFIHDGLGFDLRVWSAGYAPKEFYDIRSESILIVLSMD